MSSSGKKNHRKRNGRQRVGGREGIEEDDQKVQNPSYKINKYKDIIYNMIIANTEVRYIGKFLKNKS